MTAMGQAVMLLEDRPEIETDLEARRAVRAGGSLGLGGGRWSCRGRGILPPSAIVRGE